MSDQEGQGHGCRVVNVGWGKGRQGIVKVVIVDVFKLLGKIRSGTLRSLKVMVEVVKFLGRLRSRSSRSFKVMVDVVKFLGRLRSRSSMSFKVIVDVFQVLMIVKVIVEVFRSKTLRLF